MNKRRKYSRTRVGKAHQEFAALTRQFLAKHVLQGMTWIQCQEVTEFGDDEKDEDVVNPVTNNPKHYLKRNAKLQRQDQFGDEDEE